MPMDATDARLLKGLALFTVLGLSAYYYPFSWPLDGYVEQVKKQERAKEELSGGRKEFEDYYGQAPMGSFGEEPGQPIKFAPVKPYTMNTQREAFAQSLQTLKAQIEEKEKASRMKFAEWTSVPEKERNPGVYFDKTWSRLCLELETEGRRAYVDILDRDIGFQTYSGDTRMEQGLAEELLRKLYIAQTVIRLCIKAKLEQQAEEQKRSVKTDAFMRIVSVTPHPQRTTISGPVIREINPQYAKEKNNWRVKPFLSKPLSKFIREYPVEIKLQCDLNSFRRFLAAVRTAGQFLVIRTLQLASPFYKESQQSDKADYDKLLGLETKLEKDEHVAVQISATGMDFFDPDKSALATGTEDTSGNAGVPSGAAGGKVEPTGN